VLASRLDEFAVLHFATHAIVDEAAPRSAALVLGASHGDDGRWTLDEIDRGRLAADLVVLSACETAGGAQLRGEGVMSLARAFLHAGARATIATRWNVDDAVGPVFAAQLYDGFGAGASLGNATSEAKRAVRATGAAPRDWAAYVVTGAPRSTVRIERRSTRDHRSWLLAVGAITAIGLGMRWWRSRILLLSGAVAALVVLAPASPLVTSTAHRGATVATLPAAATPTSLAWAAPMRGIAVAWWYDADGKVLATATRPPASIPTAAAWWRVEVRDRGVVLAATPLTRVE
jgi:hypothetical protein